MEGQLNTLKLYRDPSMVDTRNATVVFIRLIFLRIGNIDTLNEKYEAEAYVEATWFDKSFHPEVQGSAIDYNPKVHWNPELVIDNNVGELKQEIFYTVIQHPEEQSSEICEHRTMKGTFWEKLELQHFPVDVQDLSISITTKHSSSEVVLKQDESRLSSINRLAFGGQQS
ncbi:unnamed protein product, partial [Didymodactylos carnosus]